jgi:hypothetical protein
VLFLQLRLSKRHVRGREEREEGAHLTSLTDIHDACALYLRELPGQLIDSPARGEDGLVGDWDLCHRGVVFVIAIGGGVDADTSLKALQIVRIEMIKKLDEWIVGRRGGGCSRGEDAIDNLSDCGASAGKRSGVWKIGRESWLSDAQALQEMLKGAEDNLYRDRERQRQSEWEIGEREGERQRDRQRETETERERQRERERSIIDLLRQSDGEVSRIE